MSGRIANILSYPLPTRRILPRPVDRGLSAADAFADEPAAVEALIPGLRRFGCVLQQGDSEGADELIQYCLERVLARRGSLQTRGDLRNRLYAMLYRRFARQARGSLCGGSTPVREHADDPDLLGAFARLPEAERSVLFLVGVDDFSYEEAAGILEISVAEVTQHLSRGRERLRQDLKRQRAGPYGNE
ncbi:MAG: RNA polymerase sigma factor [Alphaproteobacteria bacterium]|nr:RNA polymerase sigma factor [Alphaproteobacteria bacterium]